MIQLTLGIDRDSSQLQPLFDERDPAVKEMCKLLIEEGNRNGKYNRVCGQGPSNYPEFAKFLVDNKIDSMSLEQDSVLRTRIKLAKMK